MDLKVSIALPTQTDGILHIGSAGAEHIIHDILLHIALNIAERAFVVRVHGVV